ncbi:helix-turn-helix domain-containing protein, partial [Gleimia europaea]|nr:helix-turn-helix domain-containing protein [Gleimia europaea]
DIQPPDLETRIAILRKKAIAENLDVNDEVLEFIASRISSNIRELEGSLLRVTAYAQITNQEINRSLAEVVLKDVLSDPDDTEIKIAMIMGQVSDYFQVSIEQMNSADRSRQIVEARQIAMYLCRELTELSLPKIGQAFGGRDHTTVMHANKKISHQMTMKREIYNHVTELISRIRAQARQSQ